MLNWWHKEKDIMNFSDMISFAKLFYVTIGGAQNMSLTSDKKEAACGVLKHIAEQRNDWNEEQKELYKTMVDFAKEKTKECK